MQGSVTVTAGNTPGFYNYSIPVSDGTTQEGWIVVGKPAATLAKTAGD
jgi:methylaspartate ammonia-lyase